MVNRLYNSRRRTGERGFTLLELMVVMAVMLILAAIAVPSYLSSVKKAKEAVLKEDLHTMRSAIDSYTADKAKATAIAGRSGPGGISEGDP